MIDLRRCRHDEIASVMAFIDQHWRKGHVLATSRDLMDWQYRADDGSYNFILAMDDDDLLGVLGYIPDDHYDRSLKGKGVAWLALWKLRDDVKIAGLGLRMLRHLEQYTKAGVVAVNGINLSVLPLYKALGFHTGHLQHHFVLNPDVPQTLITSAPTHRDWPYPKPGATVIQPLDTAALESLDIQRSIPQHKSAVGFSKRYLMNPFYHYQVFLLELGKDRGIIVTRVACHGQAAALRIVDFIGEAKVLAGAGPSLQHLMQQFNVEYADVLNSGLPSGVLEQAGFTHLEFKDAVIVPNRFEPLERKNIKIHFAVKSPNAESMMVFRGDGDQDRPNFL